MSQFLFNDDTWFGQHFQRTDGSPQLWQLDKSESSFQQTLSRVRADEEGRHLHGIGTTFTGTEITFVGVPDAKFTAVYNIDGSENRTAILSYEGREELLGKENVPLWGLTGLGPETHKVILFPLTGTFNFDYVFHPPIVGFGAVGSVVLRDDSAEGFNYTGDWNRSTTASFPPGLSFRESISQTNSPGASFALNFTGSSITVFGIRHSANGTLEATYIIDDTTTVVVNHFNQTQTVNASHWALNQPLFSRDLEPGVHSLNVTVSQVTGDQAFYFDYVSYTASRLTFGTPREPPNSHIVTRSAVLYSLIGGFVLVCVGIAFYERNRRRKRNFFLAAAAARRSARATSGESHPLEPISQTNGEAWEGINRHGRWDDAPAPPYSPSALPEATTGEQPAPAYQPPAASPQIPAPIAVESSSDDNPVPNPPTVALSLPTAAVPDGQAVPQMALPPYPPDPLQATSTVVSHEAAQQGSEGLSVATTAAEAQPTAYGISAPPFEPPKNGHNVCIHSANTREAEVGALEVPGIGLTVGELKMTAS
ncbi:hypothetical protein FA15DRAFT_758462 [Coprinopsis marcescibilis]|uniref:Transmembrane protein n=1 Tax=Coprinopsis marcescibilis TaxID=230819 RepID=A0A5C3KP34_COPMA|nr:hypothetical protein FA15DRAFT_758462 [Coprinopsis marcescibilis]